VKLSVLMPAYNEAATLVEAIRRVQSIDLQKEIVVVDDGSTDNSREILHRLEKKSKEAQDPANQTKIIYQPVNQGKRAAIRTGLSHVTGDVVIIQDADLEYGSQDYHTLMEPITSGNADIVYGTRFYGSGPHRVLFFGTTSAINSSPLLPTS
jgi:glycosyltransferase involved in cell wall biosynthesis